MDPDLLPLAQAWGDAWRPPDRSPVSLWAERNVRLPSSVRTPNLFSRDTTPWTTPVIDLFDDPSVEFITLMAPTQSGKTNIFEVCIPWLVQNSPGNTMVTCQTESDVKLMSESRLWRVMRETKSFADTLDRVDRHAKTKTRILLPQCFVELQGPSLGSLQSKSIRYAINDEAWLYKPGTLAQIIERTSAVWNRKIVTLSQGGTAGDDLDVLWQKGSQEVYSYRCEHCGSVHPFSMQSLKWEDTLDTREPETREWKWEAVRSTVRHVCLTCGAETTDTLENRRAMSSRGVYVVGNSNAPAKARSFRVDATAVYWQTWADLVEQFLRARDALRRGDVEPLKVFTQKKEATPWREMEVASVDWETLKGSGYIKSEYETEKIEGEYIRTMTVDVQQGYFWVVARAVTKEGGSKLIWEGKILTYEDIRELQLKLKVPDNLVALDAGHWRFEVCRHCSQYNWTALVGDQRNAFVHNKQDRNGRITKTTRAYSPMQKFFITGKKLPDGMKPWARGYYWSNTVAKDMLSRLRAGAGVPWELPEDVSEDYRKHIFSELKNERSGRWEPRYKGAPNHLWDCEAMQIALLMILGVLGTAESEKKGENQDNPG